MVNPSRSADNETGDQSSSGQKRAIMALPSALMLRHRPLAHWVDRFRQSTRMSPNEIVLPAIGYTGPTFSSRIQPALSGLGSPDPFRRWVSEARDILGDRGKVWANIILDFRFFEAEHLMVRNQYGDHIGQLCITNPVSAGLVAGLADEILQQGGVDGIVYDAVDILPNSMATGLEGDLSVNCFCESCIDSLREYGFECRIDSLMGADSMFHLVLHGTSTGTDHIDPSHNTIEQRDTRALIRQAVARGFVKDEEADLAERARTILQYCEARGKATAAALRKLTSPAHAASRRSAIIVGSVDFDQSQQITLQDLVTERAADEVWVSDAPISVKYDEPIICYLASRSTYNINAYFEVLERANEMITTSGLEKFLVRLARMSARLSSNRLSPAAAYVASNSPQYAGYVGVPLFQDDHLALISSITTEVTGGALPPNILQQFRIAVGDPSVVEER